MTRTMFDLWHFVKKAFSVWQTLSVFTWENWACVGTQNWLLAGSVLLTAGWELPLLCSVPVLWALPWAQGSEPGVLWGQFPLDWWWHRQWVTRAVTQAVSDTGSCCPLAAAAPSTGESCARSQLQAQGLSPGQQPHGHCSGSELWHKTKDKSLWQLQFPKKLGEKRREVKKIQTSFCLPVTAPHTVVYSSNPQHLLFTWPTSSSNSSD